MKYEFEVLKAGDADIIFIRHYENEVPYVILIDAGNIGDYKKIKSHLQKHYATLTIDIAICTHSDLDHMGGFFGLLSDKDLIIDEFWLIDPANYFDINDFKGDLTEEELIDAVRVIYNNPEGDENLIELALNNCQNVYSVKKGTKHSILPITILGPIEDYYYEVAKDMILDYGMEVEDDCDTEEYDENALIDENAAKCIIDNEDDDESPYNKSSLIVLYEPERGKYFLFTGDATRASLTQMLTDYPYLRNIDFLKVPHHGSKHNLNSAIIDQLAPKSSYISAKGCKKHPNVALVRYLSKYGNVYSTHKCNSFIRRANGINRLNTKTISPLKTKQ